MKFAASAILFCCLFADHGTAQEKPAQPLQPTPLEAFANLPATQVLWSKQVGTLDSRESHATVTALVLEDTAVPPNRMRGIKVALFNSKSKDAIYLAEETLAAYQSALDEIAQSVRESRGHARDFLAPGGTSYFGSCALRSDQPPRVHTLGPSYYFSPDSDGLELSNFRDEFRFPDQDPTRLSTAIAVAIDELKNSTELRSRLLLTGDKR
jgi:hypothetical protein